MTQETGFYQAPPRTGAVQSATRTAGLNFGGITLPEIRLRLPSIELPSWYRACQAARMRVEAADAPWVSTGFENVRVGGAAAGAAEIGERGRAADTEETDDRRSGEARSRGARDADCEQVKREYEAKLRDLQNKIEDCEKLKRCIEDCLKNYPSAPYDAQTPADSLRPPKVPADVGFRPFPQRLPDTRPVGDEELVSRATYHDPVPRPFPGAPVGLQRLPPAN